MRPPAEIKIHRYAAGWAVNANWVNAEGERRAYAKFELGDAELPGEVATVVELIGRTTVPIEQVPLCTCTIDTEAGRVVDAEAGCPHQHRRGELV